MALRLHEAGVGVPCGYEGPVVLGNGFTMARRKRKGTGIITYQEGSS